LTALSNVVIPMSEVPFYLTGGWDSWLVILWAVLLPIVLVYAAARWLIDRIRSKYKLEISIERPALHWPVFRRIPTQTTRRNTVNTNPEAASWMLRDHPEMVELIARQYDTVMDLMEAQTMERFALQKQIVRELQGSRPIVGDFGPVPKPPRTPSFVGSAIMREAKASIALDGETQSIEPLPPMQPIAGRRIKSKDLKCTTCGAKPGTECFEMTNRGPSAEPTNTRRAAGSTTHLSRRRAAKAANGG
jgi:hypothetical protein